MEHLNGKQARELLDGATPGPWIWDQQLECVVDPPYSLADLHINAGGNGGLIADAPALAETVAWLYGRKADEGEGPDESKTFYGNGIWYIEADPEQGVSLSYDLFRGLTANEAVELARALLAAAEEARGN